MADEKDSKKAAEGAPAEGAADAKGKKGGKAAGPKGGKLKAIYNNMSGRGKMLAKVAGLVIAAVLVDMIVVRPMNNYLSRIDDLIAVEEQVIPKRLQILKFKDRIIAQYHSAKPFLSDLTISQEEEIARLLREVERVSKGAGLFVSNINPVKTTEQSETLYELSVDIEGKGGIDQVRKFMKEIELSNPPIRIDGFNFKPQGKDSDDIKFTFTIIKIGVKERVLTYLQ